MTLLHSLLSALTNLRVNKLRSILTMLGVIIGVSAVIVMVSLVEGARSKVVAEFERLGSHLIIIAYDPSRQEQRGATRRIDSLTMDDVRAIRERCDLIDRLSAEMPVPSGFQARYRDREFDVSLNGIEPAYQRLRNLTVAEGRFIADEDLRDWKKVCVLGARVRKELFPNENPIGQDIEIRGVSVTVVGVLQSKGTAGIAEQEDKSILLPITSIQKRFVGREVVGIVWAQPKASASIDAAMDQVWETLMRRHDNAPGFRVDSQQNILGAVSRVLNIFGLVLGGVAGLALLVGGIGIMNIMLVSVTERTREIGLRKAVGARRRDILVQFLIESATLSGVGGLLGIAIGAGLAFAIGAISKQVMSGGMMGDPGIPTHLPVWSILGAFAFSAFVGVFFGMWPAVRAARLDPIEALRHE